MTSLSNYDKARDATASAFLRYDQAQMIRKFGLAHDEEALYIAFIGRDYRVDRKTGVVTWAADAAHIASYNEAMSIYDVLCDSRPLCHLSHEWVNVASLCAIQGGTLAKDGDFFKNSCARFSGNAAALADAVRKLQTVGETFDLTAMQQKACRAYNAEQNYRELMTIYREIMRNENS